MLRVAAAPVVRSGAPWPLATGRPSMPTYHLMLAAAAAKHLCQGAAAATGVCRATTLARDTGIVKISTARFSDIVLKDV